MTAIASGVRAATRAVAAGMIKSDEIKRTNFERNSNRHRQRKGENQIGTTRTDPAGMCEIGFKVAVRAHSNARPTGTRLQPPGPNHGQFAFIDRQDAANRNAIKSTRTPPSRIPPQSRRKLECAKPQAGVITVTAF